MFRTIHAVTDIMDDMGWNLISSDARKDIPEYYTFTRRRKSGEPKTWVRIKIVKSKVYALKGLGHQVSQTWDLSNPKSLRKIKEWACRG